MIIGAVWRCRAVCLPFGFLFGHSTHCRSLPRLCSCAPCGPWSYHFNPRESLCHAYEPAGKKMSDRFAREVIAGGGSTAIVSAMLNPVDVVKTRRQLEAFRSTTAIEIVKSIYREGGVVALWRPGLIASCSREMVYSGCTKGLYPHVRTMLAGGDAAEPTLPVRVAAASCTGFLGSLGANAFDVVKIRQFATGASDGLGNAMLHVIRTEGLVSGLLLRGASASAPRGAAIAVGEVTTYDQTKSYLRRHYEDGFGLHVVTSLITGVVATTVAAPFDLLKSRVMASSNPTDGFVSVLARLLRHEGPLALFNGWGPTYLRLGPHAILTFPLFEAMRSWLGLEYL